MKKTPSLRRIAEAEVEIGLQAEAAENLADEAVGIGERDDELAALHLAADLEGTLGPVGSGVPGKPGACAGDELLRFQAAGAGLAEDRVRCAGTAATHPFDGQVAFDRICGRCRNERDAVVRLHDDLRADAKGGLGEQPDQPIILREVLRAPRPRTGG